MRFDILATLLALTLPYATSEVCNICDGGLIGNLDAVAYVDPSTGKDVLCSSASTEVYDEFTCSFITLSAHEPCECTGEAPEAPHPVCNICGGSNTLSRDALDEIAFNGEGLDNVSCGVASSLGDAGLFNREECKVIHFSAHAPCQCSGEMLEPDNPICNICGGDNEVKNPDGSFLDPDEDETPCSTASAYGAAGFIEPDVCASLPFHVFDSCDCTGVAPEPACNICGDGNKVQDMSGTINAGSTETSCWDVYDRYLMTEVNDDECSYVVSKSFDACGCTGDKPVHVPYECNICGDGFEITKFNGNAFINPVTNLPETCSTMSTYGAESNLSETECAFVVSQAFEPCGCTSVTKPPTESPATPTHPHSPPTLRPTPSPTESELGSLNNSLNDSTSSGVFVSLLQSIMLMCASIVFMY